MKRIASGGGGKFKEYSKGICRENGAKREMPLRRPHQIARYPKLLLETIDSKGLGLVWEL
jgi:hypothetical protein